MPKTTGKKTTGTTANNTTAKKRGRPSKAQQKKAEINRAWSIVIFALGILWLGICFVPGEAVWEQLKLATFGVFGTVNPDLPVIDFSADSVSECFYTVGETDENGNPVYDSESGEVIDGDFYFLTFKLSESETEAIVNLFNLGEKDKITKRFLDETKAEFTADNYTVSAPTLSIRAKVNRITDEIEWIELEKIYTVTADVTFKGELAVFGKKNISFDYKVIEKTEFFYAGIRFAEDSLTVAPGTEATLSVNAVIENDSDYKVSFTSSDSSVVTVDEMGYIKGIKSSNSPVTITVTLEYLGEKFTDECTVSVTENDNK